MRLRIVAKKYDSGKDKFCIFLNYKKMFKTM